MEPELAPRRRFRSRQAPSPRVEDDLAELATILLRVRRDGQHHGHGE
jgi:hypothetical protein